jgi:hypothetical protein
LGSFGENNCAEVIKIIPITQNRNIAYRLLTDLSFVIVEHHLKCFWDEKHFVFYSFILEEGRSIQLDPTSIYLMDTHYMLPLLQPSINVK